MSDSASATGVRCGYCHHVIFSIAKDNICFYFKSDNDVHILIKPEKVTRLLKKPMPERSGNCGCKFVEASSTSSGNTIAPISSMASVTGGDTGPNKKKEKHNYSNLKLGELLCNKCDEQIGSSYMIGPSNSETICLSRGHVEICGIAPMKRRNPKAKNKGPKLGDIIKTNTHAEWKNIERRIGEENFRPNANNVGGGGGDLGGRKSNGQSRSRASSSACSSLSTPPITTVAATTIADEATAVSSDQQKTCDRKNLSYKSNSLLIPTEKLRLPSLSPINNSVTSMSLEDLEHSFGWHNLSLTSPRSYQIDAILESLLRDLILVIPTGCGKTLVATIMIHRMKILNPEYIAIFVVNRIPLVYQQANYIEKETELRVCKLCSETSQSSMLNRSISMEGKYDVIVCTDGSLMDLLKQDKLDISRQCCCIVFDEVHRMNGQSGGKYFGIIEELNRQYNDCNQHICSRPRILGLTASPIGIHNMGNLDSSKRKLNELIERVGGGPGRGGGNAAIFAPSMADENGATASSAYVNVECKLLTRNKKQKEYVLMIIDPHLKDVVGMINYILVKQCHQEAIKFEYHNEYDIDSFLSVGTLGRLRGDLKLAREATYASRRDDAGISDDSEYLRISMNFLVDYAKSLIATLETSEMMGAIYALTQMENVIDWVDNHQGLNIVMNGFGSYHVSMTRKIGDSFQSLKREVMRRLHANYSGVSSTTTITNETVISSSPRLQALLHEIRHQQQSVNPDSRILIFVQTREFARNLTSFLKSVSDIEAKFHPLMIVGHGGWDGQSWNGEQSINLAAFRNPNNNNTGVTELDLHCCRLLVSTSVLEEGLDVTECDLVIRAQGPPKDLISYIQTRGRARKKENSKMLILCTHAEKRRLENIEKEEESMKLIVGSKSREQGLPSGTMRKIKARLEKKYTIEKESSEEEQASSSASRRDGNTTPHWLSSVVAGNRSSKFYRQSLQEDGNVQREWCEIVFKLYFPSSRSKETMVVLSLEDIKTYFTQNLFGGSKDEGKPTRFELTNILSLENDFLGDVTTNIFEKNQCQGFWIGINVKINGDDDGDDIIPQGHHHTDGNDDNRRINKAWNLFEKEILYRNRGNSNFFHKISSPQTRSVGALSNNEEDESSLQLSRNCCWLQRCDPEITGAAYSFYIKQMRKQGRRRRKTTRRRRNLPRGGADDPQIGRINLREKRMILNTNDNLVQVVPDIACSVGKWSGPNGFAERYRLPNSTRGFHLHNVLFEKKSGITIRYIEPQRFTIDIIISQAIISRFILVDGDSSITGGISLYIPLNSAPSVVLVTGKIETRLTNFSSASTFGNVVGAISSNDVFRIDIAKHKLFEGEDRSTMQTMGTSLLQQLLQLELEFLSVPMFETKVEEKDQRKVIERRQRRRRELDAPDSKDDESSSESTESGSDNKSNSESEPQQPKWYLEDLIHCEYAFIDSTRDEGQQISIINPHNQLFPIFNTYQPTIRNIQWLLLSILSKRLGCFGTDQTRSYLWKKIIQYTHHLFADYNEVLLGLGGAGGSNTISALLYALQELSVGDMPYWANVSLRFENAFREFVNLRSSAVGDDLCQIANGAMDISRSCSSNTCHNNHNWHHIYRVIQTPTRVIYYPPTTSKGSRLYRRLGGSERFLSVSFRDEQCQRLHGIEMIDSLKERLTLPQYYGGKQYVYFSGSQSQLREQQSLFIEIESLPPGPAANCDDDAGNVNDRVKILREQILSPAWVNELKEKYYREKRENERSNRGENFLKIQKQIENSTAAKYLSCLALFCTVDTPTVIIPESQVNVIPDIKITATDSPAYDTCLTDGVGFICQSLVREIGRNYLKLEGGNPRSALQIRWRGVKGMVISIPDDHDNGNLFNNGQYKMVVRPSMVKCKTGGIDDGRLCIVGQSRWLPLSLNREIITLLTSIPDDSNKDEGEGRNSYAPFPILQERIAECLSENGNIFEDPNVAKRTLNGPATLCSVAKKGFKKLTSSSITDAVNPLSDPFWIEVLRVYYRSSIRGLVEKTRIPVGENRGCLLIGVADPFGVLKDGEIFVYVDKTENYKCQGCKIPMVKEMKEGEEEFESCGSESTGQSEEDSNPSSAEEDEDNPTKKSFILKQDNVAIWRNPCLHPGDIRVVKAVDHYPVLTKAATVGGLLRNVIVFPAHDCRRNLALECSGGDLDGDLYAILWDEKLVPPRESEVAPLPYHEFDGTIRGEHDEDGERKEDTSAESGSEKRDSHRTDDDDPFSPTSFAAFISSVFANDLLGRIAYMHLALSDYQLEGARDELCCELAKSQSYAVDYPKTGIPPEVPKDAVKIIKNVGYPDFMHSAGGGESRRSYVSNKALGYLYRRSISFDEGYRCVVEFQGNEENIGKKKKNTSASTHLLDQRLLSLNGGGVSSNKPRYHFYPFAKQLYQRYWASIRGLMLSFGLRSDAECILGRSTHGKWHPLIGSTDRGKAEETVISRMDILLKELRILFDTIYDNSSYTRPDRYTAASVWYEIAYKDGRAKSFSLSVADILADYLRIAEQTMTADSSQLEPAYSRVGTELLHNLCRIQEQQILELRLSRMTVIPQIQRVLERKLGGEIFRLRPFGSVAIGVCDANSDLDICVDFVNLSTSSSRCLLPALGFDSIEEFNDCYPDKSDRERHLLECLISTSIEPICKRKRDILDTSVKVPVIRCVIPSMVATVDDEGLDSIKNTEDKLCQSDIAVDITCCVLGSMKARILQDLFVKDPSVYCVFMVLLRWAKEAELITGKQQDVDGVVVGQEGEIEEEEESSDAGSSSQEEGSREQDSNPTTRGVRKQQYQQKYLFAAAEFHALILYVLEEELGLSPCSRTTLSNQANNASSFVPPAVSRGCPIRVGKLILTFFAKIQQLNGLKENGDNNNGVVISYRWPIVNILESEDNDDIQQQMITPLEMSRIARILPLCEPARHHLLTGGTAQLFLELAAGTTEIVHFCQKLSKTLSFRIGNSTTFHAQRFRLLSGCCTVEIEPVRGGENDNSGSFATTSAQLMISAEGNRMCIQRLKSVLTDSTRAASSAWSRRSTRAALYFMESATQLMMLRPPVSVSQDKEEVDLACCGNPSQTQVKFIGLLDNHTTNSSGSTGLTRFIHTSLNENNVCRRVGNRPSSISEDDATTIIDQQINNIPTVVDHLNNISSSSLLPYDLALIRSLSLLLTKQIGSMPSSSIRSECFISVKLSVSFGHFLVINVNEWMPPSRRSITLSELKSGMDKCGKQRKNWDRQNAPTEMNGTRRRTRDNDFNDVGSQNGKRRKGKWKGEQQQLHIGTVGAGNNHKKKKSYTRNNDNGKKRQGIQTTFLPSFGGCDADELKSKLKRVLLNHDYYQEEQEEECCAGSSSAGEDFSLNISVSRGYEIRASYKKNYQCQNITERPLNWVHFTFLGDGYLPDARLRLQSTMNCSQELQNQVFNNTSNNCPILFDSNGENPSFTKATTKDMKRRLLCIRYFIEKIRYKKKESFFSAHLTRLREYIRGENETIDLKHGGIEKTEIQLEISTDKLSKLIEERNESGIETLCSDILREIIGLGKAMRKEGIQLNR